VEHAFRDFEGDDDPAYVGPGEPSGDHGSPSSPSVGHIRVHLVNDVRGLTLAVTDDGSGLPEGFDIDASQSLGLSIVRDLVRGQLDGTITMRNRHGGGPGETGTVVTIELPPGEAPRAGL
jgi:two-component sensor histidine kinase